jgi:hypothetical protein
LVAQRSFILVFQICIYHAFIKLTPPLLTHSLSPHSPNIQPLTVQCIILYSYIDGLFQHFFILYFFLSSTSYSSLIILPYDWIELRVCVCVCVCVCVWYIYIITFLIHSSVIGLLVCFHRLTIVNIAIINTGIQVSPLYPDLHSFRYIPRSCIPGSYGILFLAFQGISISLSITVVLICILTNT